MLCTNILFVITYIVMTSTSHRAPIWFGQNPKTRVRVGYGLSPILDSKPKGSAVRWLRQQIQTLVSIGYIKSGGSPSLCTHLRASDLWEPRVTYMRAPSKRKFPSPRVIYSIAPDTCQRVTYSRRRLASDTCQRVTYSRMRLASDTCQRVTYSKRRCVSLSDIFERHLCDRNLRTLPRE